MSRVSDASQPMDASLRQPYNSQAHCVDCDAAQRTLRTTKGRNFLQQRLHVSERVAVYALVKRSQQQIITGDIHQENKHSKVASPCRIPTAKPPPPAPHSDTAADTDRIASNTPLICTNEDTRKGTPVVLDLTTVEGGRMNRDGPRQAQLRVP